MTCSHLERRLRHAVQLDASVTRNSGESRATLVTDLSLDGCCITGLFTIGERVEIKVRPIGTLKGQIRWAFGGKAGVRFDRREQSKSPRKLVPDITGVAAIEYAFAAALIAVAIVAALTGLGQKVEGNWNNVDSAVDSGVDYSSG